MLKINTTSKYAEFKSDTKSDLYPLNEISYTVENESETVSFYNRFYNKIMTEQISNIQVNDVPVNRDNIQDLLSVLFAANEGGGGGTVDLSNYYTKPEVDAKIDTKVDKVEGKQLSTEDYTTEEKTKLAGLENYDDTIVKADIASNTTAIEAEVERATAAETALDAKIPTVQTGNIGTNKNYIYSIYNDTVYSVLSSVGFVGNEADVTVFQAKWGGGTTQSKLNAATVSKSGVMSSADKTKLDSLSNYDDTTVKDDIAANKTAIEAEVVRAKAAEKVNADAISALDTAYKTADATLDTKIDAEVTRATNAESELNTKIETKVDKVDGKQLSTEDYTTAEKSKLASLSNYDDSELRTLIETKADKDKYEKVIAPEDDSVVYSCELTKNVKYHYIDIDEIPSTKKTITINFTNGDNEIDEMHLFIRNDSSKTILFTKYSMNWKEKPTNMVNGAFYEFIFTWVKEKNNWFAGYIKYE